MTTTQNQFLDWYRGAITAKIRELKKDGTVAIGEENLFAIVRVSNNQAGAPVGTNARFYLHEMFRHIVSTTPAIKRFILNS